jgi:hypothetical protein
MQDKLNDADNDLLPGVLTCHAVSVFKWLNWETLTA